MDGTASQVISGNLPSHAYISAFSDKMYFTICHDHRVFCCNKNGSRLWTFKYEPVLKEPHGITVDKKGNVYVVGSSNVVKGRKASQTNPEKKMMASVIHLLSPLIKRT